MPNICSKGGFVSRIVSLLLSLTFPAIIDTPARVDGVRFLFSNLFFAYVHIQCLFLSRSRMYLGYLSA